MRKHEERRKRKIRKKKFRIPPLVLVAIIALAVVAVAIYITLQFNITMNYQQYPKVTFWEWGTSQKKNSFDYSVSIFAGIKTVDENITHGIFNDDSVQHQCYVRIKSLNNHGNIAKLNITIYDKTHTAFSKEWTEFGNLPTSWESFTMATNAKYTIWIETTATGNPSGASTFEIEVKENNS